jgi:hypothetical protein
MFFNKILWTYIHVGILFGSIYYEKSDGLIKI